MGFFAVVFFALIVLRQLPFVGGVFRIPFVGFYLAAVVVSLVSARLGTRLVDRRRLHKSVRSLGEVDTPHNRGKLGALFAGQGKHKEALGHLEAAGEYEPELAEWAFRVGRSRLALGDASGAAEALTRAVGLDEEHGYGEALRRLAEALTRQGSPEEALERLDPSLAQVKREPSDGEYPRINFEDTSLVVHHQEIASLFHEQGDSNRRSNPKSLCCGVTWDLSC